MMFRTDGQVSAPLWVGHGHCMESYGWRSMTLTANTVECFQHPSTKSGATSCDGRDEGDLESTQHEDGQPPGPTTYRWRF